MIHVIKFRSYICESQQKQNIVDYFSGVALEILLLTPANHQKDPMMTFLVFTNETECFQIKTHVLLSLYTASSPGVTGMIPFTTARGNFSVFKFVHLVAVFSERT